MVTMFWL